MTEGKRQWRELVVVPEMEDGGRIGKTWQEPTALPLKSCFIRQTQPLTASYSLNLRLKLSGHITIVFFELVDFLQIVKEATFWPCRLGKRCVRLSRIVFEF